MEDGMAAITSSDEQVLTLAKTHAARDVNVWMHVLKHLAERKSPFLKPALRHVEQLDVLPPLLVLKILSSVADLTLGTVKSYLAGQIERALRQAEADEAEVAQLKEDTSRMREELRGIKERPIEFRATTCALTGAPLELPTVHFLSKNSYNLSSLQATSSKLEDPKCASAQRDVSEIARGLARNRREMDEEFFGELDLSVPGDQAFAVIAEFFGKFALGGVGNGVDDLQDESQ